MTTLAVPSTARLTLPRWLPLACIFVLAVFLRHVLVANTDVSWDLTAADKFLDGQRLYVDVIEVNPPATVLLYVVPALLGRLSGIPAEFFVDVLVFLAIGLSLWLSGRVLRKAGLVENADGWLLATVTSVALMLLPAQTFSEREHIGLIAFLPLLAVCAARAKGNTPDLAYVIAAGICGGIVVIIKPHFAAAIICTSAAAALYARSWRPVFALENWIAAALLAAYVVFVVITFPPFVYDVLPMVMAVYVPVKANIWIFVTFFATPLWLAALLLIARLKGNAMFGFPLGLLLAASVGFLIAYYVQQKGWPYHSYPMLALALIALALAFFDRWHRSPSDSPADRSKRLASALAAATIAGATFCWMNVAIDCSALAAPIRAIKPHPKILALSADLAIGHPLTRAVQGTWVGRASALWVTEEVMLRRLKENLDPQTNARLEAYAARDRTMLAQDIARHRPDIILVNRRLPSFDWLVWANSYPALAAQLKPYRPVQTIRGVLIMRREKGR
jgi:hypothetical protein